MKFKEEKKIAVDGYREAKWASGIPAALKLEKRGQNAAPGITNVLCAPGENVKHEPANTWAPKMDSVCLEANSASDITSVPAAYQWLEKPTSLEMLPVKVGLDNLASTL